MISIREAIIKKIIINTIVVALIIIVLIAFNLVVKIPTVVTVDDVNSAVTFSVTKKYVDYFTYVTAFTIIIIIIIPFVNIWYFKNVLKGLENNFTDFSKEFEFKEVKSTLVENKTNYVELEEIARAWNHQSLYINKVTENRESYTRTVVHNLKNNLQIIKGNIDIYLMKNGDNKYISAINEEIDVIDKMLISYLKVDEIENFHNLKIVKRNIYDDISCIVKKYTQIGMKVEIECQDKQIIKSYDLRMLENIIDNLLENARKYATSNYIKVRVDEKEIAVENEYNGQQINSIFDGQRYQNAQGSGLGTLIIYKSAKLMNWRVSLNAKDKMFCVEINMEENNE